VKHKKHEALEMSPCGLVGLWACGLVGLWGLWSSGMHPRAGFRHSRGRQRAKTSFEACDRLGYMRYMHVSNCSAQYSTQYACIAGLHHAVLCSRVRNRCMHVHVM